MAINVTKVNTVTHADRLSVEQDDVFTYRDEYNEEKVIMFPAFWEMTEQQVEDWLNDNG